MLESANTPLRRRLKRQMIRLCEITRESAREGEHEAARLVEQSLRQTGARTEIRAVPAVGNYWMPLGAISLAGAVCGLAPARGPLSRVVLAGVAAAASTGAASDISAGNRWIRAPFRRRLAHNVLGWAENQAQAPEQTIVFCSHHDAAPAGLIFHPQIPRTAHRIAPEAMRKNSEGPPVMYPVVAAPAISALGRLLGLRGVRTLGAGLSLITCAVFCDIALRRTVPGANDNASGVVALSELARALSRRPLRRTRVLFLSTGSEESMLEGMEGFARERFKDLDPAHTMFVCIDTVGSSQLCVLGGEGMLRMYDYPRAALKLTREAAEEAGVDLLEGLRHRNSTDALYPLRAGYPTVMIGSVNEMRVPANYHWHTDTEANVSYSSIEDAVALCERVARRVDEEGVPR